MKRSDSCLSVRRLAWLVIPGHVINAKRQDFIVGEADQVQVKTQLAQLLKFNLSMSRTNRRSAPACYPR